MPWCTREKIREVSNEAQTIYDDNRHGRLVIHAHADDSWTTVAVSTYRDSKSVYLHGENHLRQIADTFDGPAARRAIKAAATAPQYTGTVITARQARQILANPHLAVYDNPHTLLMCVYKRDKALRHRGLKDTPSLDQCVPACANIARTDQHATGLRRRATALDQQAGHVPGPLGERLRSNATRLRDLADAHHRTCVTLQDGTA
jgi:hypothetical protein